MTKAQFQLEVYEPGSESTVIGAWPTAAPLPIAVGDVLRTGGIDPHALPSTALRVARVEHALFAGEGGVLRHKLMVFTEVQ